MYDASDALCSLRWMLLCCGHYHRRLQGAVCSCRLPIVLLQHCLLQYAVTALSSSDDLGDLGRQGHLWQCHCVVHFSFLQLGSWTFFVLARFIATACSFIRGLLPHPRYGRLVCVVGCRSFLLDPYMWFRFSMQSHTPFDDLEKTEWVVGNTRCLIFVTCLMPHLW
jgi:hypothetical protein